MREDAEDFRIFRSRRTGQEWAEPERVPFGASDVSDLYPAPAPDGKTLVFTSYRPFPGDKTGRANANLWCVVREDTGWSEPRPMTGASTTANYDSGPWFDSSGTLHFASTTPDWAHTEHRIVRPGSDLTSSGFDRDSLIDPWADWSPERYVWHAIPGPDGQVMLLDVSETDDRGRRGPSDLWLVRRQGDTWTTPARLGPTVNTPREFENFPVFTPDGRYLLFDRGFETYFQVSVADLLASVR